MTQDNVTPEEPEKTSEPVGQETSQETLEGLQKQVATLQETSQKHEGSWKEAERVKTRLGQDNQRLREQLQSNDSQSDMMKALVAMMATNQNKTSDELTEEIKQQQPDLMKQYEQIVQASDRKREIDRATNRIKAIQERAEGLKVQGDEYDVIRAFAEAGKYDKAESRLDKLETVTEPPESKESEDERVERLVKEKYEATLKEKGLLIQDIGVPSASGKADYTMDEFRKREKEIRTIPVSERAEARQKLQEAFRDGRVK